MIICVDIDQVLNDLIPKTLALYNSRFGKNIQISDITSYDFYECLPKEDAKGIIELFKDKELWNSVEVLPDSRWGIETLINMGHKVIVATATHESNFEWKCRWMTEHFPMINTKDIIRIHNKGLLRVDVMIEDCLDNLTSNVCERICLDYPYNRSSSKDYAYEIYRAANWRDIIKHINNIERKMKEWEKNL
jgi:5'(3')-deoxyribonucleotidase